MKGFIQSKVKVFFTSAVLALAVCFPSASQQYFNQYRLTPEEEAMIAEEAAIASGNANPENSVMSSQSFIHWGKGTFSSSVDLDIQKAGIVIPSGKASAVDRIQMNLPKLIKNPLLSIYVDDVNTLGDLVLSGTITLEELTILISQGKQTPPVFASGGEKLQTQHSLQLQNIGALLVKHKTPYTPQQPITRVASRAYSGIIIDARGTLPVKNEFISSKVSPCLFPKVYTEDMDLLYERNMVDANVAIQTGIVQYGSSDKPADYKSRVGSDPLWITARAVYGVNRCDPVISQSDYLRIMSVKENRDLLRQGKVVILVDSDELSHAVSAPRKDLSYYISLNQIQENFPKELIPDTIVVDAPPGIRFELGDLKFVADSAELLPEEQPRIIEIAESLKRYLVMNEYSILVEGHTADVNKPNGQMQLSIERAKAIIEALVAQGLDRSLFTYKGYGGTQPVADNSTPEGRAQNRRVTITVTPKSSYIQYQ